MSDVMRPPTWPMTRANRHGSSAGRRQSSGLWACALPGNAAASVCTAAMTAATTASSAPRPAIICADVAIAAPSAKAAKNGHVGVAGRRPRLSLPGLRAGVGARLASLSLISQRARARAVAGPGLTVIMAGAARNTVFRTRKGEGSDAVGVALETEIDVVLAALPRATLGHDEDPRRYVEQTAPAPSRRMIASVCRSSVGPEGRLSLSTFGLEALIS